MCVSSAYSECNVIYKLLTVSVVRVTGSEVVDQIFTVLLSTSMFVGGVTGFILDTSVPGNRSLAVGRSHTHTHTRARARALRSAGKNTRSVFTSTTTRSVCVNATIEVH